MHYTFLWRQVMRDILTYGGETKWPYWGGNKMAINLHRTFSNPFSCMKITVFWFQFHWSLILWDQLTINQYWFSWQANTWRNEGVVYWCIYPSLSQHRVTWRPCTHMGPALQVLKLKSSRLIYTDGDLWVIIWNLSTGPHMVIHVRVREYGPCWSRLSVPYKACT